MGEVVMVTKVILLPRNTENIPLQQHINTVFSNQHSVWTQVFFELSPVFFSPKPEKTVTIRIRIRVRGPHRQTRYIAKLISEIVVIFILLLMLHNFISAVNAQTAFLSVLNKQFFTILLLYLMSAGYTYYSDYHWVRSSSSSTSTSSSSSTSIGSIANTLNLHH